MIHKALTEPSVSRVSKRRRISPFRPTCLRTTNVSPFRGLLLAHQGCEPPVSKKPPVGPSAGRSTQSDRLGSSLLDCLIALVSVHVSRRVARIHRIHLHRCIAE